MIRITDIVTREIRPGDLRNPQDLNTVQFGFLRTGPWMFVEPYRAIPPIRDRDRFSSPETPIYTAEGYLKSQGKRRKGIMYRPCNPAGLRYFFFDMGGVCVTSSLETDSKTLLDPLAPSPIRDDDNLYYKMLSISKAAEGCVFRRAELRLAGEDEATQQLLDKTIDVLVDIHKTLSDLRNDFIDRLFEETPQR